MRPLCVGLSLKHSQVHLTEGRRAPVSLAEPKLPKRLVTEVIVKSVLVMRAQSADGSFVLDSTSVLECLITVSRRQLSENGIGI